jgi:GT2 family glycosyltransferase
MAEVTIGFVPRDRFCVAAESLRSIIRNTSIPFELMVVDTDIPPPFRGQIDEVLAGRGNVHIIETDEYLLTHQCHNLVVKHSGTPFLCLMENDNLVHPGWLESLVAACEEFPAGVAVPFIHEQMGRFRKVHFDERQGHIERSTTEQGTKTRILPRRRSKEEDLGRGRRRLAMIESHCMLFTRDALRRTGPFDERLSTRAEMDISLALHQAGVVAVLEPGAQITFNPPPPIHPQERSYYLYKWDLARAEDNHAYLASKWGLEHVPTSLEFARQRRSLADEPDPHRQVELELERRARIADTAREVASAVPEGEPLLFVDQAELDATEIVKGRRALPFLERDGEYWGAPANAEDAIAELERERDAGIRYIAFAWPAFWWLGYYAEFGAYLRQRYECRFESERLVVFDLR